MAPNEAMQPVRARGWRQGLLPLLRKELSAWWGTQRWWLQLIIWNVALNGLAAIMLFVIPSVVAAAGEDAPELEPLTAGVEVFFQLGLIGTAIGAIVLTQDAIIGERERGITEWILSKPVAREAYLVAKWLAHGWSIVVLLVLAPAVVHFSLISSYASSVYSVSPYLWAVAIFAIHTLFYLSLSLALGVVASDRGAALGIGLAVILGGSIVPNLIPASSLVTPWALPQIASALATEVPLPSDLLLTPVGLTALYAALCFVVSVWAFNRQELD